MDLMDEKKNEPLLKRLLDAGYPIDQVDHHYSDLYVYVTPLTTSVIDKWLQDNGWKDLKYQLRESSFPLLTEFTCQITGRRMYDIAFQYWEDEYET